MQDTLFKGVYDGQNSLKNNITAGMDSSTNNSQQKTVQSSKLIPTHIVNKGGKRPIFSRLLGLRHLIEGTEYLRLMEEPIRTMDV